MNDPLTVYVDADACPVIHPFKLQGKAARIADPVSIEPGFRLSCEYQNPGGCDQCNYCEKQNPGLEPGR